MYRFVELLARCVCSRICSVLNTDDRCCVQLSVKVKVLRCVAGCSKYSLYEVTVHDFVVKQRRLPDQLGNLADRCSFFSRFEREQILSFILNLWHLQ